MYFVIIPSGGEIARGAQCHNLYNKNTKTKNQSACLRCSLLLGLLIIFIDFVYWINIKPSYLLS